MSIKKSHTLTVSLLLGSLVTFSGPVFCGDNGHFKYKSEESYTTVVSKEMDELETLYTKANSPKVSQGEAEKARQAAFSKARHILRHINTRSDSVDPAQGGQLSATEMLLHTRVMGHLLDLVAAEHQPHEDKWSYTY